MTVDKSLRQEIQDANEAEQRREAPLDPSIYAEEENAEVTREVEGDSPVSFYSASSEHAVNDSIGADEQQTGNSPMSTGTDISDSVSVSDSSKSTANYPFILPLKGDKKSILDSSCSLMNIWSIAIKAILESILFGFFLILPAGITFLLTDASWYDFRLRRWDQRWALFTPVMEFYRISTHAALIYAIWTLIEAGTRIAPLLIRRSWQLLGETIPNPVKTTLAGWKSARHYINLAVFGFLALVATDSLIFGSSKLVSSATAMTSSTLTGLSRTWEWTEKALISLMTLSLLILGQKILMQLITRSYRKQALAPRILDSNFKFRVLTRLFRQTNLGEADVRRSIAREQAREALHPPDEDFVEISKDLAGLHLTSPQRAETIAAALWGRICPLSRDYLVIEDFRPFFTLEDTPEAFQVFDLNGTGIINSKTWLQAVQAIRQERLNLTLSIRMSDASLRSLEAILNVCIFTGWLLSVLGCISPRGYTFLTSAGGFIFGFGFLFKDSCERIFKSFIFVLVEHPFDIGDLVLVDKNRFTVLEMQLFQTTFKRCPDASITYIPNSVLVSKYIYNETRSGITTEALLVTLPANTSIKILGSLQARLTKFLAESYDSFTGNLSILPIEVQDGKMNVKIECNFNSNDDSIADSKYSRKDSLSNQIQTYLIENNIAI